MHRDQGGHAVHGGRSHRSMYAAADAAGAVLPGQDGLNWTLWSRDDLGSETCAGKGLQAGLTGLGSPVTD